MAEIVVRLTDNPVPGAYKRGDLVRAYPDGTVGDVWSPNRPDVLVRVPDLPLDEAQGYCAEVYSAEILSGELDELGDPIVLIPSRLLHVSRCYMVESRLPEGTLDDPTMREFATDAATFRALIEERV